MASGAAKVDPKVLVPVLNKEELAVLDEKLFFPAWAATEEIDP